MRNRLAHTEPTPADLAAIEAEWPLIAAELDVLDAEITMLYADDRDGPSPLDWQRLRRAHRRVLREAQALMSARPATDRTDSPRLKVAA